MYVCVRERRRESESRRERKRERRKRKRKWGEKKQAERERERRGTTSCRFAPAATAKSENGFTPLPLFADAAPGSPSRALVSAERSRDDRAGEPKKARRERARVRSRVVLKTNRGARKKTEEVQKQRLGPSSIDATKKK